MSRAAGLALGGTPTEGVVAAAASPYINEQIKHATKDNPTANTIAHAVWGAVESKFQGGRAEAGAAAAAVGELGAAYIAESLYGTNDPNKLTEAQKQTVTELSKTAAGLASGLTSAASGGNSTNIAQATQTGQGIAESAVENNSLGQSYSAWSAEQKLKETDPEAYKKLREAQHEILANSVSTFVDFVPIIGDIKGVAEAETTADYLFAALAVIPLYGDAANKAHKVQKNYELAKEVGDLQAMKRRCSRQKSCYFHKKFVKWTKMWLVIILRIY